MSKYTLSHEELEEYKEKLNIPLHHHLQQFSFAWEQRQGQDTDIFELEEFDSSNQIVARYRVKSSISIYPPFTHDLSWEKL